MPPLLLAFDFLLGLLLLLFGRRVFWLFVAVAGFVTAMHAVPTLMPDQPQWVVLTVAVLAGVVGAILAVFLQYVAAGLAGVSVGTHIALGLHAAFGAATVVWVVVLAGLVGGLGGVFLFNWAIILLSAYLGATLVLAPFGFAGNLYLWSFVALFTLGVILQASMHLRLSESIRQTGT